jgi:hypothetical protein
VRSSRQDPAEAATTDAVIDFFVFGRIAARDWVRSQWERAVREHLTS